MDVYISEEYVRSRRRERKAAAAAAAMISSKRSSEMVSDSGRVVESTEKKIRSNHNKVPLGFRFEKKFLVPGGLSDSTIFNCLSA
ncbi:hypothetical protein BVC80_1787g167 [Macleaya cordata]|uniref:Uncharacterized protein n=1 Tax=Macleaya cordata TaxID=56857 RepID=A0A200QUH6_MACCD|nr:hypothetical protein BVC80_1787g167 [Macleaya cordata]